MQMLHCVIVNESEMTRRRARFFALRSARCCARRAAFCNTTRVAFGHWTKGRSQLRIVIIDIIIDIIINIFSSSDELIDELLRVVRARVCF
jgi:hypothetical protein